MSRGLDAGSTKYLSLALSARSVMQPLQCIASGQKSEPGIDHVLRSFLASVQPGNSQNYISYLQQSESAPSFEETSTCEDIVDAFGSTELVNALESILTDEDSQQKRNNAQHLLKFFDAVEIHALENYSLSIRTRSA